jgi:gliding motility-associated-like protein
MLRNRIVFILLLIVSFAKAQNLVPNGDFENHSSLPTGPGEWSKCNLWSNVNGSIPFAFPYASPDYLHTSGSGGAGLPGSVFGNVNPYSGNAIFGLVMFTTNVGDFREYLSVQLSPAMVAGTTYNVSFWITNGQAGWYCGGGSNHIGIRFSTAPLAQATHEPIGGTPDYEYPVELWTTTWQNISFTYTPTTTINHMTLGNFYNDATTTHSMHASGSDAAYYFVDKFEITPGSPGLQITGNSQACSGDSIILTATGDSTFSWASSLNPAAIISTGNSITVAPSVNTTYLVYGSSDTVTFHLTINPPPSLSISGDTVMCTGEIVVLGAVSNSSNYIWSNGSYSESIQVTSAGDYWLHASNTCGNTYDTISIQELDCIINIEFPNVFTPNNDHNNDSFLPFAVQGIKKGTLSIYNRWGQKIFVTDDLKTGWNGNDGPLASPEGTYYWLATYTDIKGNDGSENGFLTLAR